MMVEKLIMEARNLLIVLQYTVLIQRGRYKRAVYERGRKSISTYLYGVAPKGSSIKAKFIGSVSDFKKVHKSLLTCI